MHPLLRNLVWHALNTTHQHFSIGGDLARRYPADVTPFCGIKHLSKASLDELASVTRSGETIGLVGVAGVSEDDNWHVLGTGSAVQMVYERDDLPSAPDIDLVQLNASNVPEIFALIEISRPGPFLQRTIEMGEFFGVRQQSKLVAMAGTRTCLTGYREITAVTTHPDYRGRGYGTALIRRLIELAHTKDCIPFLHVVQDNTNAIRLYEQLGFVHQPLLDMTRIQRK